MTDRAQRPAIEGWLVSDPARPRLLGTRCTACGTYYFPPQSSACRNPDCRSRSFEQVELSERGRVWSVTSAGYAPPPPYIAPDPYVPFTLVAVELERERMVVLGQAVSGTQPRDLRVGDEVELAIETLCTIDGEDHLIWKWRPVAAGAKTSDEVTSSTEAGA